MRDLKRLVDSMMIEQEDYNDMGRGVAKRQGFGLPMARKEMTPAQGLIQAKPSQPAEAPMFEVPKGNLDELYDQNAPPMQPGSATDDIINQRLRRESGAAISDEERRRYGADGQEDAEIEEIYYENFPQMKEQAGTDAAEQHKETWKQNEFFQRENPQWEGYEDTDAYNEAFDNWLTEKGWQ